MSDDRAARGQSDNGAGPAPPRSWLTPYLLMLLRSWHGYGYDLVRQLALFGFGWVDPAAVYRALRELERDGYVQSHWDTSGASGPARRLYAITDAGVEALGLWAATLEGYRQLLDRFFQSYAAGAPPAGAAPGAASPSDGAGAARPGRRSSGQ
jgi:poly-beta-hydroxybutyrate-responsive repressor